MGASQNWRCARRNIRCTFQGTATGVDGRVSGLRGFCTAVHGSLRSGRRQAHAASLQRSIRWPSNPRNLIGKAVGNQAYTEPPLEFFVASGYINHAVRPALNLLAPLSFMPDEPLHWCVVHVQGSRRPGTDAAHSLCVRFVVAVQHLTSFLDHLLSSSTPTAPLRTRRDINIYRRTPHISWDNCTTDNLGTTRFRDSIERTIDD
jgi:hypothetical protein